MQKNIEGGRISKSDIDVQRINEYIEGNFAEDISLQHLARVFSFRKEYFCTMYKKLSGKTLTAAIRDVRLRKACELLADSNVKISEVAREVGYDNVKYFSKIFHKQFNITPSKYHEKFLK